MGIFDSITRQVFGGGGGGGGNDLLNAVMGMIGNQSTGGLEGLVKQFAQKGLGDIANSWVGVGKNLPISPEQLQKGLGKDLLAQLAGKAGIPTDKAASALTELLPKVVDRLTPTGTISQDEIAAKGMDLLKGLLK